MNIYIYIYIYEARHHDISAYVYIRIFIHIYVYIFTYKWIYIYTYIFMKPGIMTCLFLWTQKKYYVSESWYIYETRHHGVSVEMQLNSHEPWLKIHGWWMMMSEEWCVMTHELWFLINHGMSHGAWVNSRLKCHDSWLMPQQRTIRHDI